jgi:hypothetical protein
MKTALTLLALLLLTGCSHKSDQAILKNLPGTWHFVSGAKSVDSTFIIATNGDFTCRSVSLVPTTNPPIELAGVFQVKDSVLIETVTNSTQPRIQGRIPFVSRVQIVKADAHEIVATSDGTDRFVFQKETP